MTQLVGNPFPLFLDRRGRPLDGGSVYIGEAGQNPQTHPVDTFFDAGGTVPAPQPLAVIGGVITNAGNPALVFADDDQFSMRVKDADGVDVFYLANAMIGQASYQPLDSDLTAIAALSTTSFGRQMLALASAADARTYFGVNGSLPLTGGAMTGDIIRSGAGAYGYAANGSYTSLRFFFTENGADDPRTQTGDVWFEAEA